MPMIKIILFELTRILLGYASDKVGEFIRNKQRNEIGRASCRERV